MNDSEVYRMSLEVLSLDYANHPFVIHCASAVLFQGRVQVAALAYSMEKIPHQRNKSCCRHCQVRGRNEKKMFTLGKSKGMYMSDGTKWLGSGAQIRLGVYQLVSIV